MIKYDQIISKGQSFTAERINPILSFSNETAFTDLPSKAELMDVLAIEW